MVKKWVILGLVLAVATSVVPAKEQSCEEQFAQREKVLQKLVKELRQRNLDLENTAAVLRQGFRRSGSEADSDERGRRL